MQGWSYVGDRLLSAVIPYEESGWYDGQMWVKPPEVSLLTLIYIFLFYLKVKGTKVHLKTSPAQNHIQGVDSLGHSK